MEEFRRQNEREEARGERDRHTVATKIQFAQIGKAKIDRDQRNGERGEEFQHPGGEEGKTQHFHGPMAKILGRLANTFGFGRTAAKNTQGIHSAQTIEEMAAQTGQCQEVTTVGIGGTHANQRHKQWNKRRGNQQNQRCSPV